MPHIKRRSNTKIATIDSYTKECVEVHNGKSTFSSIYKYLKVKGVAITRQNLSTYLSTSDHIQYDRKSKCWIGA
jgi:hypothetical protein